MGSAFRDAVDAALARSERLADENADLKQEIERLRAEAKGGGHATEAPEEQARLREVDDEALAVLERLAGHEERLFAGQSALSRWTASPTTPPEPGARPSLRPPAPAEVHHATPEWLGPPRRPGSVGAPWWLVVLAFALGFGAHACLR